MTEYHQHCEAAKRRRIRFRDRAVDQADERRRGSTNHLRWLLFGFGAMIAVGMFISGCKPITQTTSLLPTRNTVVRDQLLIYSDFELAKSHRLVEDLAAQRSDLAAWLALPTSDEPIHVYLFSDQYRFNDFIRAHYPAFPPRRAFFVESDTRLAVYAQWGDRVAEDLRHEVAHGYLHSVVPNLPLWLDEGLAEYFEVARGHGGLNQPHVVQLAAALGDGSWRPDMARLETLRVASEMTQIDYAESWAWVHWLLNSTPENRLTLQNYLQALRRDGTAEPLSRVVHRTVQDPPGLLMRRIQGMVTSP